MKTFLLLLSITCFVSSYTIHKFGVIQAKKNVGAWCAYMDNLFLSAIPWISGFVLAVIPEVLLFNIFWIWMFLINILIVLVLGPILATIFLKAFASGKGTGYDSLISLIIGTGALTAYFIFF